MADPTAEQQLQEAILQFTLGEHDEALKRIDAILQSDPEYFDALLAKTEVLYADKAYEQAKQAAEAAEKINSDDVHLKTSLSRIWMQLGDKEKAEAYGADAKVLSWKQELTRENPQESE